MKWLYLRQAEELNGTYRGRVLLQKGGTLNEFIQRTGFQLFKVLLARGFWIFIVEVSKYSVCAAAAELCLDLEKQR